MPTGLDTEAVPGRTANPDLLDPIPLLFIGGTGRSGTHVVSKILNSHSHFRKVPNEARFHTDPGGLPDVLTGVTGPDLFAYRLRHHWWRNFEPARLSFRGLHRYVPRTRLDAASTAFLRRAESGELEAACRQIFFDLLWPLAAEESKAGLIEQSCDVIAQAGPLGMLFPEARFIHVVRDGRDVAASRVGQARWAHPRTMKQGLEWWEGRIRRIEDGIRAAGDGRVYEMCLDDLVSGNHRRRTYRKMRQFAGLRNEDAMLEYFIRRVKVRNAHTERWREDVPARQHAEVDATYEEVLDRLEADGVGCVPLLRQVKQRRDA